MIPGDRWLACALFASEIQLKFAVVYHELPCNHKNHRRTRRCGKETATPAETNRLTAASANITETTTAASYTSSWNSSVTATHTVSFDGGDEARYFFNAGGFIKLNPSLNDSTGRNAQWAHLLDEVGDLTLTASTFTRSFSNVSSGYGAGGNSTRGIFAGGYTPTILDTIDFITIASEGNATDFGNLVATTRAKQNAASSTRCVIAGGTTPTNVNTIEFVTISTTSNTTDFGDLQNTPKNPASCSDVNGGLGD
mgnify:CR=1 FL=1